MSEFVVEAILLKLALEGIPIVDGDPRPDPIAAYFRSPEGRALLRKLVHEELEG